MLMYADERSKCCEVTPCVRPRGMFLGESRVLVYCEKGSSLISPCIYENAFTTYMHMFHNSPIASTCNVDMLYMYMHMSQFPDRIIDQGERRRAESGTSGGRCR